MEPLAKALLDDLEERRVREQAAGSIYRLGGSAGADALKKVLTPTYFGDYPVRAIAAEALGRLGQTEAVPALIDALADETARNFPILRKAVVGAIGAIGDPNALGPLQNALKEVDYPRDPGEIALTNQVLRKLETLGSGSDAG